MSGFSADWLALREGADHRARNRSVRDATAAAFLQCDRLRILDLACGSGSNLRALAPCLPRRQNWRLVDFDRLLLAAACDALLSWADEILDRDLLIVRKEEQEIQVEFLQIDLARDMRKAFEFETDVDLVTSAAFFDLVSEPWINEVCDEISRRGLPLNAVLTYSGEEIWRPPHPSDSAVLEAFHRHQMRDKGFGPAVGPHGVKMLRQALEERGYAVISGPSPWRLGAEESLLMQALAEGAANAVSQTGSIPEFLLAEWRLFRMTAQSCEIGHVDIFAIRSE
jgi:SAM-dependent methyltransferase